MKVSVIMPAYNAESTVRETLYTVLCQTYSYFELLICLDACTDNTENIVRSFNDPRIKILSNEFNLGAGKSRDKAIPQATGDWLAFIDADDLWDEKRIEKLLSVVKHNPLLVGFDNFALISENNQNLGKFRDDSAFSNGGQAKLIQVIDLIKSPRMLMQPFFSKKLLDMSVAKHSSHAYGEDTFFLLMLLQKAEGLVYYPETLYYYRVGHISASSNPKKYILLAEIIEKSIAFFGDNKPVQDALMIKLKNIKRENIRYQFSSSVKSLDFALSLSILVNEPLVIWYFFKHNLNLNFFRIRSFFQKEDK